MTDSLKSLLNGKGWMMSKGDTGRRATHLFLDGGRAAVPDDSAGLFLNMYATALVRKEQLAVVEVRTHVFKLFLDFDARILSNTSYDFELFFRIAYELSCNFYVLNESSPKLVVCASTMPKCEGPLTKMGFHLVWTNVFTTSNVALEFREALLEKLESIPPLANPWADAIDACVFKANGFRMPWSVKSKDDQRTYVPVAMYTVSGRDAVDDISPSVRRAWIHELSIRVPRGIPSPAPSVVDASALNISSSVDGPHGISKNIEAYAHVLPAVASALPALYGTVSFTGLFKCDHVAMLRTTNRYCANVGREHTSSQIYFSITRHGIAQRCYCRKDPDFERMSCEKYIGPVHELPKHVIDAFLGDKTILPPPLPTSTVGTGVSLDELLKRSRPSIKLKRRR
jgi:hypothetical protein